jgi:hypothetical protein
VTWVIVLTAILLSLSHWSFMNKLVEAMLWGLILGAILAVMLA